MDNVTHSLIGVTLGHALTPRRLREDPAYLRAAVWTSVAASNFADLDSVFARFAGLGRMGYLLHHRGYSHTLIFAPVIALAAAALGGAVAGRRSWETRSRRLALLGVGLAAALLHLFADFWNDYGIHPLAPFFPRWFYGDFVFIIEPSLWLCMLPFAFQLARRKLTRGFLALLGAGIFAADLLALRASGMPVPAFALLGAALFGWAALCVGAQRRYRSWIVPAAGAALVLTSFGICSRVARVRFEGELARLVPAESVVQLASSPFPSNPICWRFMTASRDGTSYVARQATLSLAPGWIPPQDCVLRSGRGSEGEHSVALSTVRLGPSRLIAWSGEFRAPISALRTWFNADCRFRELLHFARIPFWQESPSGLLAGDLRYDRGKGLGFATFLLSGAPEAEACEPSAPGWEPPVHELLNTVAAGPGSGA